MFKYLLKIGLFLITISFIFIFYLSFFGIKTNKFNDQIRSQISEKDNRFNLDLDDVFIKLNLKERSISLNSKDLNFYINKESQKIANVDILIDLISVIKKENRLKKIIINSKENDLDKLLKFIRSYKINIPALYLENSVTKGKITYDLKIDLSNIGKEKVEIKGRVLNTNLNILKKENIENINLSFSFIDNKINIKNLNFKYKNLLFNSKKISARVKKNLIKIDGDFENKINLDLISKFTKLKLKNYFDENMFLSSSSNFEIIFNKNLKIEDYKLTSNVKFDYINFKLKNNNFKSFIVDYEDKIIFKNGKLKININKKNNNEFNINSQYTFNENYKLQDFKLNILQKNLIKKFNFYMDLSKTEIFYDLINFHKKIDDEFFLYLDAIEYKDNYEIENLKISNSRNNFIFKNIKLNKFHKITGFDLIKAEFQNKDGSLNDIILNKKNNEIELFSKEFDISSNIENSLKSSTSINFLDIFDNLNTNIKINIRSAKLDKEYSLKNLKGYTSVKNNKIDKTNLSANFNSIDKFLYTKNKVQGNYVTTIFSDIAIPFVNKFEFIEGFEDGKLDYTSTQIKDDLSKSELRIYNFKLKNMPVLTKLLSLASLQGIADLATGEGIRFEEFDMYFDNSKNLIKINEIYALGPAISILMEGYIEKNKLVSLKGTLVPATTINKTIAKIPLLGDILVGTKAGEGVFGVSFKIKGPPNNLDTRVNPIKSLTPRFITRTLEKIKKTN